MRGTKPHLAADPKGMANVPRPPAWLTKDAKAEWKRVVPLLVVRRILTDADLGTLENYVMLHGSAREAHRITVRDGITFRVEDKVKGTKQIKRHPAVGVMNECASLAARLAAELGLTPVSRSRPAIRDDATGDDDDGLDL